VLVPGALLGGIALAGNRLTQSEIFQNASGTCPFCGKDQSFTILGRFRLPRETHCKECGRELSIEKP
jgi:transcription elongation factor Elf1